MPDMGHDLLLQAFLQLGNIPFHVHTLKTREDTFIFHHIHAAGIVGFDTYPDRLFAPELQRIPFLRGKIPEFFVRIKQRIILIYVRLPA